MHELLDAFPLPWSDRRLQELRAVLATAFFQTADVQVLAADAGIPPHDIDWNRSAWLVWHSVLDVAAGHQRLRELLQLASKRRPALRARLEELFSAAPIVAAPVPQDAQWRNFSPDNRERKVFENEETLLDIAFLERGLDRAAAVCRLTVEGGPGPWHGTGFRIGEALLLTNHHVLYDDDGTPAHSVRAEFHYELDPEGNMREPIAIHCDPASIRGEAEDDFAVVETLEEIPGEIPILPLSASATPAVNDRVIIVQHPNGLPKKIAFTRNLVRFVDAAVVQYWTETRRGSSGSPVFDASWNLVALHHQWVEADGDIVAFRNQGRNIRRVAERLAALGLP